MKTTKIIAAIGLGAALVGTATSVSADSWQHGYTNGINAYSNYYSSSHNHGSEVVNRNNGSFDKANQRSGAWSHATIGDIWDPASFYYNPTSTYSGAQWK